MSQTTNARLAEKGVVMYRTVFHENLEFSDYVLKPKTLKMILFVLCIVASNSLGVYMIHL